MGCFVNDCVERAYEDLASYVQAFIDGRDWETAGCDIKIFDKMASGSQWLLFKGQKIDVGGFEQNSGALWAGLGAAVRLRDDLLKSTGDRIWGLSFILEPSGRFDITYDYERPEE